MKGQENAVPEGTQGTAPAQEAASKHEAAPSQEGAAQEYFFEATLPDGQKQAWKSKEELSKEFRASYLRQSDYQRHLAEIKKQKEEYEAARKKFNEESEQFKITKAQYDEWDKLLKGRPEIYRQLLNAAKSPAQPKEIFEQAQGYTDQTVSEVRKELEELRAWRDSMEASKHRQAAIANLKAKYPDADEQAITEVIKGMTEGGLDGLLDTAYHSIKGRSLSPAQVADRIARGMEKNKGATLSEPGQQSNSGRKYKNTDEAMKAAYNDFGLATL